MEIVVDRERAIPISRLPEPENAWEMIRNAFWRHYSSIIHPRARDFLLKARVIRHSGRQDRVLGRLATGKNFSDFLTYLEDLGFGNHFIAWVDEDEVISLRRLDGYHFQYHLRVFRDGEVRGHYEYTPEAHPIAHLKSRNVEDRREDFMKFLGDWVDPVVPEGHARFPKSSRVSR